MAGHSCGLLPYLGGNVFSLSLMWLLKYYLDDPASFFKGNVFMSPHIN